VLFAHPQAVAHGLNLQERGHHVCWHSLPWDFELFDQFNRRVLRQGNPSAKVFVHFLIAKGTIDETIYYVLKAKDKGQQALFTALKDLAKRRRKAA
jgi:SNF2 family DNA or RNA helicase